MAFYPKLEEILIYEGRYFTAEWYYDGNGKLVAYEYYLVLPEIDRRKFFEIVKHYCDNKPGTPMPSTMYKIEDADNKIYAFKPRKERYFNFTTSDAKVIITNAYRKHSQKMTKQDLKKRDIAAGSRIDYLNRTKEGAYYEA